MRGTYIRLAGLLITACATTAGAWFADGHARITAAALRAVDGAALPLAAHTTLVVRAAADPDLFGERTFRALRDAETPEHYFDAELLGGDALPATRSDFVALCAQKGLAPRTVGFLPYALQEGTERLATVFAECRRRPDDPDTLARAALHAGALAHYAADTAQPLHLTVHFDGRVPDGGVSPRSGIHGRVDALAGKLPPAALRGIAARPFDALRPAIEREIAHSREYIERVYALDPALPGIETPIADPDVEAFAADRARAAAAFVAGLWLTAWNMSAEVALPEWHTRLLDELPALTARDP